MDTSGPSSLRVEPRAASSGASFRCDCRQACVFHTALIPSSTMLAAIAPIASIGWRIVVRGGVHRLEAATSSKPTTEQCSGHADSGVGERANRAKRRHVVERHQGGEWALAAESVSSVSSNPVSKLEMGSRDSGRSTTSRGSISSPRALAKDRIPSSAERCP